MAAAAGQSGTKAPSYEAHSLDLRTNDVFCQALVVDIDGWNGVATADNEAVRSFGCRAWATTLQAKHGLALPWPVLSKNMPSRDNVTSASHRKDIALGLTIKLTTNFGVVTAIKDGGSPPCSISPPSRGGTQHTMPPALPGRQWRTTKISISVCRRPKRRKHCLGMPSLKPSAKTLASPCG